MILKCLNHFSETFLEIHISETEQLVFLSLSTMITVPSLLARFKFFVFRLCLFFFDRFRKEQPVQIYYYGHINFVQKKDQIFTNRQTLHLF